MLLIAEPGSWCSLEVLDDVVEEKNTGVKHLVQSKSTLGSNPISDRAKSLWKTLFNWLHLVENGHVEPDQTIFEIYVSRPVDGDIASAFSGARNNADALAALQKARLLLWGSEPEYLLKSDLSEDIAKYVNTVLAAKDSTLISLIKNLRLMFGSGSPQSDLEEIIATHPVSASKIEDIANYLCGLVKRDADKLLEQSLPAILSRDEFHLRYAAYCRRVDRETILTSFAPVPTKDEALARMPEVFVQQLDLLDLEFEDKLEAISDFLMASADRTIWSKMGEVDEKSFDELDDELTRTWKNKQRANGVEHRTKSGVDQGLMLYAKCMEHKAVIQAMSAPPHFIPGCFHRLADTQEIGWHPSYLELLRIKTKAVV